MCEKSTRLSEEATPPDPGEGAINRNVTHIKVSCRSPGQQQLTQPVHGAQLSPLKERKSRNLILQRISAGELNPSPTSFPQLKSEIPFTPLAWSLGPPEWGKSAQKWEWGSGWGPRTRTKDDRAPGRLCGHLRPRELASEHRRAWMSSLGQGPRAGLATEKELGIGAECPPRPAVLPFLTSHAQRRAGRPTRGPPWHTARASVTAPAPRPQEAPAGRPAAPRWLPTPASWELGWKGPPPAFTFPLLLSPFKQIRPHVLLGPASVQDTQPGLSWRGRLAPSPLHHAGSVVPSGR